MIKVVVNQCYGGFGVSDEGFQWLINKGWRVTTLTEDGKNFLDKDADIADWQKDESWGKYSFVNKYSESEFRSHPDLIEMVETLGKKANGRYANLVVVEIPDDAEDNWEIGEYDGTEWVQECHRRWG